jgi:hypothetical protein
MRWIVESALDKARKALRIAIFGYITQTVIRVGAFRNRRYAISGYHLPQGALVVGAKKDGTVMR